MTQKLFRSLVRYSGDVVLFVSEGLLENIYFGFRRLILRLGYRNVILTNKNTAFSLFCGF